MISVIDRSGNRIVVCDRCYHEDYERRNAEGWSDPQYSCPSTDEPLGDTCHACKAFRDARRSDPTYRHHLFSIHEAYHDLKSSHGARAKVSATGKLAGKLLANVSVMGAKLAWKVVKKIPEVVEKQKAERQSQGRE